MAFYGLQMQRTQGLTLAGAPTPSITSVTGRLTFDDVVVSGGQDSPVTYDNSTGLFSIFSGQSYYISWFITIRTGLLDPDVKFSLYEEHYASATSTTPVTTNLFPSTNSMKTGQLTGSAILSLTKGQVCKFGLYNTGDGAITLASYPGIEEVNANITIHPYVVGSYSSSYGLIGMSLTLDKTDTTTLLGGNNAVKFNVVDNAYPDNFSYKLNTGEVVIKLPGNYLVNWSVNLDGSEDTPFISFSLITGDGTTTGTTLATFESTLLLQQAYSGFSFITTNAENTTFRLVNTCKKYNGIDAAGLTYSTLTNKATLRLIGHS